jgi:hypothetical protein
MKGQLPSDSSGLTFIDVMPADRILGRQSGQQKTDVKGEPQSRGWAQAGQRVRYLFRQGRVKPATLLGTMRRQLAVKVSSCVGLP